MQARRLWRRSALDMTSRRKIFGHWQSQPAALLEIARQHGSHQFLTNASGCQPYLYLSRYVAEFCVDYWQQPPEQIQILDWGCGKGQVTYLLRERGFVPISADIPDGEPSRPILEKFGLPWVALDHPYRLPFADETFHALVSFGVLEHVPDDQASLHEIRRVLRPGGVFFCFDLPRWASWIMRLAHLQGNFYHDRLYTLSGVKKLLTVAGLEIRDSWVRQVFPKNRVRYPFPAWFERLDQWLCAHTPLAYLATSLEFVAVRPR